MPELDHTSPPPVNSESHNPVTAAVSALGKTAALVGGALRLPGVRGRDARHARPAPGVRPGIESHQDLHTPPEPGKVKIRCIEYGREQVESAEVDDLDAFLNRPQPAWAAVRWINVDGLHPYIVNRLREKFGFHTLAAEDILHVPQRPKLEAFDNHLFLVTRMLRLIDDRLVAEQVSFVVYKNCLITFQEFRGDVWEPIRGRIQNASSRMRQNQTDYLLYALLDAVVDHGFPILEYYGDALEELDQKIADSPDPALMRRVHEIKRDLVMLRRVMWPMRDLVAGLRNDERDALSPMVKTYMRDVHDHTLQVIEVIETYREMSSGLTDLYMSAVSNRMNEVMKVLTIMASFFIPITFLAGVYGMNFENIPELRWKYSYVVFWGLCVTMVSGLFVFFRRKGWMGGR